MELFAWLCFAGLLVAAIIGGSAPAYAESKTKAPPVAVGITVDYAAIPTVETGFVFNACLPETVNRQKRKSYCYAYDNAGVKLMRERMQNADNLWYERYYTMLSATCYY